MIKKDQIEDFISDAVQTELDKKLLKTAVVDALTSTSAVAPLSANQGKVLKGFIDAINTLLASDDVTLDELQELVNFIKQNKSTLDTLAISNIAGLVDALAAKEPSFLKNTAFNRNFAGSGTLNLVARADHNHPGAIDSGSTITLDQVSGRVYNYDAASAVTSYALGSLIAINGYATCLINAPSEPSIAGATKISGATFAANTNMEMVVESKDGITARYFFLKL